MNKADLIGEITVSSSLSKTDVAQVVEAVFEGIIKGVNAGEDVRLPGFGTFTRTDRAARTARNPRTGESINVPASKAVKFKVAKGFKDTINS